jgi:endo-1,4-beta-xylanase
MYDDGVDGDSLREVLAKACKKVDIGAAVLPKPLLHPDVDEIDYIGENHVENAPEQEFKTTTRYARALSSEFNAVVVEHHLKWAPMCTSEPGPLLKGEVSGRLGRYDFHHADSIVNWAIRHKMKVKGHVLAWHVTSPSLLDAMSPEEVKEQLRRHIFTTMAHFHGRIKTWDVVNESLAPDGTLADNVFLRKLGPDYIEQCFRWAHEAYPEATLLYNDNKVEGMNGPNAKKADAFYHLLADLKQKKVPIHGCGIQAHFNAAGVGGKRPPTPRMVKNQIHRLGKLGLNVNISEMDVRVSQLPPNLRQIAQRQIYRDILAAALTESCFDGCWLWGFTDRHTWVTHFYHDDEPLIYDDDYTRKEAYYGLREALTSITPGGVVGANVPLYQDEDEDGNAWGHLWMQPEPEHQETAEESGESKPDWLLEEEN